VFLPIVYTPRTYYVSPTGNDRNPGTRAQPWQTVKKAATTATAGDTVVFEDGVYDIGDGQSEWSSGLPGREIVFRAEHSRQAIWQATSSGWAIGLDGQHYLRFDGLTIKGDVNINLGRFVSLENSDHITFSDCEIGWVQGHVLALWGNCTNIQVIGCEIHSENADVSRDNIHIRNGGNKNILIEDTQVYHSGHGGIDINAGEHVIVRNCNVHHNQSHGISVGGVERTSIPLQDILIEGNRAHHNGAWGGETYDKMGVRVHRNAERVTVESNVLYQNTGPGIQVNTDAIGPVEILHNTLYANDSAGTGWGSLMLRKDTRPEGEDAPIVYFYNNIVYHLQPTWALYCESGTAEKLTTDYNLWYGEKGLSFRRDGTTCNNIKAYQNAFEPHSIFGLDPLFTDPPDDVSLQNKSPACNVLRNGDCLGAWQPPAGPGLPDRP
jgi:hypothetical protein